MAADPWARALHRSTIAVCIAIKLMHSCAAWQAGKPWIDVFAALLTTPKDATKPDKPDKPDKPGKRKPRESPS